MNQTLEQTPLHAWHAAHQGRMVDFAGWSMPVQYGSIVAEHEATRTAAGLFDVSHMGRFWLTGPDAEVLLERIFTRSPRRMKPGQVRYGLITNRAGGVLDDVLLSRVVPAGDEPFWLLVVNASNRIKIWDWLLLHTEPGEQAGLSDRTRETAMIAVQGPLALQLVQPHVGDLDLAGMKYYTVRRSQGWGDWVLVSRTGYTGEDGCELILPKENAVAAWEALLAAGADQGARPAGLGCRDTLRLEAGMPLYGHELEEEINPIQADLKFALDLADRDFIGRDAIALFAEDPGQPVRIGLEISGRRAAREGSTLLQGGERVGVVTSGSFSPTLEKPIAMGYVIPEAAAVGATLEVDIRGKIVPAKVVSLPFYRRPRV